DALFESVSGVPRILDPETYTGVSVNCTRVDFETFVRRVREARRAAELARQADTIDDASAEWIKVFGSRLWPSDDAVRKAVAAEAAAVQPGRAVISSVGIVSPSGMAGTVTRPTRFYGRCPD
ncbi:MAG: hypothetical protein U0994_06285, partial [Gemmatimonadales bacterium]|nr:hypothetical protein [Gemmatimonadales bacterium]